MIKDGATIWARQTIESDIFINKPDKWFKIWFYIINKVRYKKMGKFERGQNFIKYQWISDSTGATKNQIDHFLRWAKEAQMLATRKATRGMVVNVLQYSFYQDLENYKSDIESELKANQKRIKSDTILKNDKNDKNDKNILSKDNIADNRNQDIEFILKIFENWFKSKVPIIKGRNGFDLNRGAAQRLSKNYGLEKVKSMIEFVLKEQNEDKYCRKSTNPLEFEKNLLWYKTYFESKKNHKNINIINLNI